MPTPPLQRRFTSDGVASTYRMHRVNQALAKVLAKSGFLVNLPSLRHLSFAETSKAICMGDVQRTRLEVAEIIERFLEGTGGPWDWDDFCSHRINDPELESVRHRCSSLDIFYPPAEKGPYCGEAGFEVMRQLVVELRIPQ